MKGDAHEHREPEPAVDGDLVVEVASMKGNAHTRRDGWRECCPAARFRGLDEG